MPERIIFDQPDDEKLEKWKMGVEDAITELEQKFKLYQDNKLGFQEKIIERIEALEKNYKFNVPAHTHGDYSSLQKQISELKKDLEMIDTIATSTALGTDLLPSILKQHIQLESLNPDLLNFESVKDYNSFLLRKLSGEIERKGVATIPRKDTGEVTSMQSVCEQTSKPEVLNPYLKCNGKCWECEDNIPSKGTAPNQCGRLKKLQEKHHG